MTTDNSQLRLIQERFDAYCAELNTKLTGSYPNNELAQQLVEALGFWKGIISLQNLMIESYNKNDSLSDYSEASLKEKILEYGVDHANPFIALISKVEFLPTHVFRRALWFYNIDFQSLEAFLRRITATQIASLEDTYNSYVNKEVPECFTRGFKNKVRQLFNRNWKRNVFDSEKALSDEDLRYQSKGAVAYEFFGIDFGHAMFGDESDKYPVQGNRQQRFFSKNKMEDFVVNQEDGVYWWLYRTIRSNPVWNSDSNVQLKAAICPGFWITLLAWLYVLVGSPLSFIGGFSLVAAQGKFGPGSIVLIILGLFTPLASLFLLCKTGFAMGKNFVEKRMKIVVDEKFLEILGFTLLIAFCGSAIAAVTFIFWSLIYLWCYESVALATWITAATFTYVAFAARWKKGPWKYRFIGPSTLLFVIGKLLVENRDSLYSLLLWTQSLILEYWLFLIVGIVYIAVPLSLWIWSRSVKDNNDSFWSGEAGSIKTLDKISALTEKVAVGVLALTIALPFAAMAFDPQMFDLGIILFLAVISTSATLVLVSYIWSLSGSASVKASKNLPRFIKWDGRMSLEEVDFFKRLSNNAWMRTQPDYLKKAKTLHRFVKKWFNFGNYPKALTSIDQRGFYRLAEYGRLFSKNTRYDREEYVSYMLTDTPSEVAEKLLDKATIRHRERIAALKAFYSKTLGRIVRPTIAAVVAVFSWIKKISSDAIYLWNDFQKRCSYWRQGQRLDLDLK